MNITFPSASSLVDRLVKSGWVERGLDPDDRRIIRLTITKEGSELSAKMKKEHKKVFQAMLSEMPEEDRQSLYRILSNLHTKLEQDKDKKGE
jgi:MarR family transcriptional regulator, organic hydroperoxide resistance regulator